MTCRYDLSFRAKSRNLLSPPPFSTFYVVIPTAGCPIFRVSCGGKVGIYEANHPRPMHIIPSE